VRQSDSNALVLFHDKNVSLQLLNLLHMRLLDGEDVVRHRLVKEIIKAYDKANREAEEAIPPTTKKTDKV
jgi:phosphate starvation-inducible protein PhoH